MIFPNFEDFKNLYDKGYKLIPIYKEVLADLDTPVSIFYKIAEERDYTFLLESVEGGKYSFICADYFFIFASKGRQIKIISPGEGINTYSVEEYIVEDPLTELKKLLLEYSISSEEVFPVDELIPFYGGAVGYIAYDYVRFIEKLPTFTTNDMNLYDLLFIFAKNLIIFSHIKHTIKVVSNIRINNTKGEPKNPKALYQEAIEDIENLFSKLKKTIYYYQTLELSDKKVYMERISSNFKKEEFIEKICLAKEYIKKGDAIQIVLSQRFQLHLEKQFPYFNIYRNLRIINPSPYMFFLKFKDIYLIGASPEMLVRVDSRLRLVETRPIAGTRKRGITEEEDKSLEKELLNDPKELAEHIMLVDLGRNDIGRICKSVKVDEFKVIERYSHVMHIVSSVKGEIVGDADAFSVMRACFPAGTLVGAPKVRAMELIEELEPTRRATYGGAVCYFGYNLNLDSCITIRTILIKDNIAYIQAGAGIVAYSQEELEYQETCNKAKALICAITKCS